MDTRARASGFIGLSSLLILKKITGKKIDITLHKRVQHNKASDSNRNYIIVRFHDINISAIKLG